MSTEIELVQKPVIRHALVEIGINVTARLDELNIPNLVPTEETVKALKNLRTELTKELADYEADRKALKEAVAAPYMEFEVVYKTEIAEKYKWAIETLKDKVAIVEDKVKADKKANVVRYFSELCQAEQIDFLKFENVGLDINLSTTENKYKEKVSEYVQRVADDILLIGSQQFQSEIMAEYKITLNASKAITAVVNRKEAEKLEADRIKQAESNRRTTLLRGLSMAYFHMTKTFNWVRDDKVNISLSDIENLSKEDFQKRFVELEALTKVVITQATPVSVVVGEVLKPAPTLFNEMTNGTPANHAPKTVAPPISAPVVEAAPEPVYEANFQVTDTMPRLMALKAYLIDNKFNYKNI